MKRHTSFFPFAKERSKKLILFVVLVFICIFITYFLLRFCYESYFVLHLQTKKLYRLKKRFLPTISENDITKLKQQVTKKFEEKKRYQKMLHGKSKLFDYYQKIREALENTSTLTHCAISSTAMTLTAESALHDEADRVLEKLQKEDCFSMVKIRSSEKTANNGYVYTIAITPKRSGQKKKKR